MVMMMMCRCIWLPMPCEHDWRRAFQRPLLQVPQGLEHRHSLEEDLEPVYATISEITDSMDETAVLPSGQRIFGDLSHVFADLAALPVVQRQDCDSGSGDSTSSPPALTDAPVPLQFAMPHPLPDRVERRTSYRHAQPPPSRFLTYC